MTTKTTAIYCRVSSNKQEFKSQLPDLKRWAESHKGPVKWYREKASGKSMDRPQWKKLRADVISGKISKIVVWRLDRLGRTCVGLVSLFEDLQSRKVRLISLKDAIDLGTASGRLMANVLASVAAYENEVRGERVRAGQSIARANGKTWGGSKPGVRRTVTRDQIRVIRQMKQEGVAITRIAKTVQLSRPTIYSVLNE